jgi:hypothetical protein
LRSKFLLLSQCLTSFMPLARSHNVFLGLIQCRYRSIYDALQGRGVWRQYTNENATSR